MNYSTVIVKEKFTIGFLLCVFSFVNAKGQQNKPLSSPALPVPSVTVPAVPAAYTSGVSGNYVRLKIAASPITDISSFNSQSYKNVKQVTKYLDGLGRHLQTVVKEISPGATPKDIVNASVYNEFGMQDMIYMPYTSTDNTGNFKTNPFNNGKTFLQSAYPGEEVFYSKIEFEDSPFKRPLKSYAQGNSWAGSNRGKELKYEFNTAADAVRIWTMPYEHYYEDNFPYSDSEYPAGSLYKNISIDESGNATVEYIDYEGKLILRKVQVSALATAGDYSGYSSWLCTYYAYDDFGRLRFVMPPKAVKIMLSQSPVTWIPTDVMDNLCFRYEYDHRNRLIARKVPDAGWAYMIYDNRDRLVFTQDANMRSARQWMAILYDELNRPVLTGRFNYPSGTGAGNQDDQSNLQAYVSSNTGSGLNTNIVTSYTSATGLSSDTYISTLQLNDKIYQASNSITWDPGFETDDNTNLLAEIVPGAPSSVNENIIVNDNPLPAGNNMVALTINYYDEYSFKNKSNNSFVYSTVNNNKLDAANNLNADDLPASAEQGKIITKNLLTGSRVRVISDPNNLSAGTWLTKAFFFDEKERLIQIHDENYKGGTDIATYRYNFSGAVLTSYYVHSNPSNTEVSLQTISIKTNYLYDHAGRLLEIRKKINDDIATERTVLRNEYNTLGQLQKKKIGGSPGSSPTDPNAIYSYLLSYTRNPSEVFNYDYNIRGWLKGVNKDYANGAGSSGSWFGMELCYDWGFTKNQFNGNVSGTKWRSKGDEEQRAYGYDYDRLNRLQFADFSQKSGGSYADDAIINFDIQIGTISGGVWSNDYDENGNILKMKQWGVRINSNTVVDDLSYNYLANSNKLKNVIDASNEPATVMGDFRSSQTYMTALGGIKTASAVDYGYDLNGNLKKDLNKDIDDPGIQAIQYNHLNLPWKVTVKNKGVITYIYDALGTKLEKITVDNTTPPPGMPNKNMSTVYLNGFNYENGEMKFFGQEEGRVRITRVSNQPVAFNYDYFIRDNLGNVRVILTDEQKQDTYPAATLEDGAVGIESGYYNIQSGNIVEKPTAFNNNPDYPYYNNNGNPPYNTNPASNVTAQSQKLYKLNGSTGNHTGLGIVLEVMTGDAVDIFGKSYYAAGTVNNNYPVTSVLTNFINTLAGASVIAGSGKDVTPLALNNSTSTTGGLNDWLGNVPNPPTKPKAYINWVLLDEQFRVVSGNCGFDPVDDVAGKIKSHHQEVSISKSGYLYVYCSNESNIDVLFDNLQLIHTRGPLLETDEYYPFGGTAFAISYKAALSPDNNYKLSGNELQANEFAAGTGLEFYDFNARMYDAQIGRFMAVDPLADNMPDWNPYGFAFDNPVYFVDPSGLEPYPPPGAGDDDYRDDGGPDGDMYDFSKPGFPGMFENDESTQKENLDNVTLESYKGFDVRNFDFNQVDEEFDRNEYVFEAERGIGRMPQNAQSGGECPNCLNPTTTGNNLLGLTYPGGNNPKSYNGQYNYSYVPTNLSEYPAIGHDRRYDNLKITGASGLFTDTRAIGADWRFVGEELSIAANPYLNPIDRMSASILGVGLGLSALPKTLFQLSTPFGYMQTMIWYNISNQGVNNTPTIHKH